MFLKQNSIFDIQNGTNIRTMPDGLNYM